ncbi:Crp/Fnr family transcriptional regulator [Hymenobacter terrenus]|uniref:Crp/Fnr family transcriptional regulator n=1 Tax=Hymenobacter terrenus TaxID=1629124 RepID=UPI0006962843|nr:Crp/Fnr family transcriptional regulator [Hymenobacter terrenus]
MESLLAYLESYGPLPDADKDFIAEHLTLRDYPKHGIVLQAGNVCRQMYYLESGLVRYCYLKEGKDITASFAGANMSMTVLDSLVNRSPSPYTIEALEPTRLYSLAYDDLTPLFARSHAFEHISRLATLDIFLMGERWMYTQRFQSAHERYESFLTMYASFAHRVPLTHVASYLGITLETLSRIRAGRI